MPTPTSTSISTPPSAAAPTSAAATASRPVVLVLGANGRFGLAAAQAFCAAGWQVVAPLRRDPVAGIPAGVRVSTTRLEDTAQLAREAASAQVVVHAVNPVYTRWATELLPTARCGMDVAQRLGARLLLPGNVYNFGAAMPSLLREDTPQRATTRKGTLRIALEAELVQRSANGQLRATVIRAGDFFGGGSGNWFDLAIAKSLRAGRLVYPGPTDVPHAWAYLPDLARAFVAIANRPTGACAAFERFHFAGNTVTGDALLTGIAQAAESLGVRPASGWSRAGMPWRVIRLGGLAVPVWRELAEMAYLWHVPHALDGRALEAAVGLPAGTALPDALRQTLAALGYGRHRESITTAG